MISVAFQGKLLILVYDRVCIQGKQLLFEVFEVFGMAESIIDDLVQECTKFERNKFRLGQQCDVLQRELHEKNERLLRHEHERRDQQTNLDNLIEALKATTGECDTLTTKADSNESTEMEMERLLSVTNAKEDDMQQQWHELERLTDASLEHFSNVRRENLRHRNSLLSMVSDGDASFEKASECRENVEIAEVLGGAYHQEHHDTAVVPLNGEAHAVIGDVHIHP